MINILKSFGVVALVLFIIAIVVLSPIVTIWMLNTLFPVLAIPYTFWTWLAAFLLNMYTVGLRTSKD